MFRTALVNAPRSSSASALRPTRSLGALRSTAASQAVAATGAAAPPVPYRGLVSTVLLTRESYDAKNVQQLKAECKQRGLTTSGKRADIVARLLNDDAQLSGSGLTTEPQSAPSSRPSTAHAGAQRGNASLASLRGPKEKQKQQQQPAAATPAKGTAKKPAPAPERPSPATEASPASATLQEGGASIPHPPSIKPGQVQAPGLQTSSTDAGISSPDSKLSPDSNPPGVPPQNEPNVPQTFKVDIPYEQPTVERGPEIPIVTAYTSNRNIDASPESQPSSSSSSPGPRVVTTADQADVIHALDLSSSAQPSQASEALSSATRSIKRDLGLTGDLSAQAGQLRNTTANLRAKASEATSALIAEASSALSGAASNANVQTAGDASSTSTTGGKGSGRRPMNGEEKRGLYVLGGLILGGFTLGGFGKPKKTDNKH